MITWNWKTKPSKEPWVAMNMQFSPCDQNIYGKNEVWLRLPQWIARIVFWFLLPDRGKGLYGKYAVMETAKRERESDTFRGVRITQNGVTTECPFTDFVSDPSDGEGN